VKNSLMRVNPQPKAEDWSAFLLAQKLEDWRKSLWAFGPPVVPSAFSLQPEESYENGRL